MTWHPFQEWSVTRFAKSGERRDGKTVYRMSSVPGPSHRWWLGKKHPLWRSEAPGNICVVCSMLADHPNHRKEPV